MKIMMRLITFAILFASTLNAQDFTEYQDPAVNQVNRLPMHATYFAYAEGEYALNGDMQSDANYLSLNGKWKFDFAQKVSERPLDFFKLAFDDSKWGDFDVPAVFELNGFGTPMYLNKGFPWKDRAKPEPPLVPEDGNYVGSYRKSVKIPANWQAKDIIAHFGAVSSCFYLWVNGEFVGYSEDSRLEAEFDLTKFLKVGEENLIAFQVFRWCDGTWLEDQDAFRYTGLSRDVYLYAREKNRIEDINIEASLDDKFENGSLNISLKTLGDTEGYSIDYDFYDLSKPDKNARVKLGEKLLSKNISAGESDVNFSIESPKLWSSEEPNLYMLIASFKNSKGEVLETISQKVGFRNIEIKDAQVFINGKTVLIKGVNRHDSNPKTGSYLTKADMLRDIKIIKSLNINAVRTSHYPNDSYFYELCDLNGLMLCAEANLESHGRGYGSNTLAIDKRFKAGHLERNERNVQRNRNHPSIIFWSLGNEAGMGENFIDAYRLVKNLDKTRLVQYGKAMNKEGTDILCPMYRPYSKCEEYAKSTKPSDSKKPLILCEYAHAMGNSMGGLSEYIRLMKKYPKFQGGFIWDFADQSVYHKTKEGVEVFGYSGDFNDYDYSDNKNFCNNGIVNPDRRLNPHADEVQYQYQYIWTKKLDGSKIEIENEHYFIDLAKYKLNWEILADGDVVKSGKIENLNVPARAKSTLDLAYDIKALPSDKELFLNVYYSLKADDMLLAKDTQIAKQQLALGQEINTFFNEAYATNADINVEESETLIKIYAKDFAINFDKQSGYLCGYEFKGLKLLEKNSQLRPSFWRALTDNDMGYGSDKTWNVWRDIEPKLKSINYKKDGNNIALCAEYTMEEVDAILRLDYIIDGSGVITVNQDFKLLEERQGKKPKNYRCPMLRFGMRLEMPLEYRQCQFYGRGEIENYIDRNQSTFIGKYNFDVKESHYEYIRPQESGTRTDIRYWKQLDAKGNGLAFSSKIPFSASALLYTMESLDDSIKGKQQRHWQEVAQSDFISLHIDKIQMGLGCINSWTYLPQEQKAYEVSCKDYTFSFKIIPLNKGDLR